MESFGKPEMLAYMRAHKLAVIATIRRGWQPPVGACRGRNDARIGSSLRYAFHHSKACQFCCVTTESPLPSAALTSRHCSMRKWCCRYRPQSVRMMRPARKGKRSNGNAPAFDLRSELYRVKGADLTQIEGINVTIAQAVLAETGPNMSAWRTENYFVSWLRLCPDHRIRGGKVLKRGVESATQISRDADYKEREGDEK